MVIVLADATIDDGLKNRVAARDAVRHNWQERRRQSVRRPPSASSVCYIVKNTWIHLWSLVDSNSKQRSTDGVNSKETVRNNGSKSAKTPRLGQRHQFPSVVSILQKNEIFRQVQSLQDEDEALLKKVLSVLPTAYDWTRAIQDTASKRSRAFWLLDLSVIMRNVFTFRNQYGIQCVYDVHRSTNADPVLLKVLLRSNVVTLATTTKWDLERCRSVIDAFSSEEQLALIQDSTTCCGKPDGYIREWIRANNKYGPLVVDGPAEVLRISNTVKRMRQRDSPGTTQHPIGFVLRFETANPDDWRHIAHETASCLAAECCGRLVGLSFKVPVEERAAFFENLEQFLSHLSHQSEYSQVKEPQLNIDFNGAEVDDMLTVCTAWISQIAQRDDVGSIKVDVTRLLMASAGALCTRVIGVREQAIDKGTRMHYYIDDGCYGSLCARGDSLAPLPLFSREGSAGQQRHETTIWGPTCDGLDKVCERIRLPLLQRDDWLVFAETHIGSEGLSTAFNGFDPPDTAYCVLGYFENQ